jgi:hypothetical protein
MRNFLKRVFVSGCYDILHAGHVQFFKNQSPKDRNAFVECHAPAKVIEPFVRGYGVS